MVIAILFILLVYFTGGTMFGLVDSATASTLVDVALVAAVSVALVAVGLLLFPVWKVVIVAMAIGVLAYGLYSLFGKKSSNSLPVKK